MRVAIVTDGSIHLPWTSQGTAMEILTYELAYRLAQNCVVIVYTQRGQNQKKIEYDKGVIYRRISIMPDKLYLFVSTIINKLLPGFSRARARNPFFSSILYYMFFALQVARDCKAQNCDIIHIHNLPHFVPILRIRNRDAKIVLHMHSEWLTQLDREKTAKRIKTVDLFIGCSEYITQKIRDGFPDYAGRCHTIHNGVDIEEFASGIYPVEKQNKKIKRLLFVGRNSPEKGVHVLLEAYQYIEKTYPQVELKIVGPQGSAPVMRGREMILYLNDDPKVLDLESFYREDYLSGLQKKFHHISSSRIFFTGFIPRQNLIDCYKAADIFIFPSVWEEPFGMPVVEAMATGVPVVASRVGGIKEVVEDGRTGILVPANDVSALANAILTILFDDCLRESMGKAALKRAVDLFSWEQIANKLLNHYKKMLSNKI